MRNLLALAVGVSAMASALALPRAAAILDFHKINPNAKFYMDGASIRRVYGPAFATGINAEDTAIRFLKSYSSMFGVAAVDLHPTLTTDLMRGKFTMIRYEQRYYGIPVHGAYLTLVMRTDANNSMVLASNYLKPIAGSVPPPYAVSSDDVLTRWRPWFVDFTFSTPAPVVYIEDNGRAKFGYQFTVRNTNAVYPEKYLVIVDGSDPKASILFQESRIYDDDVSGSVQGWATPGDLPDVATNLPTLQPIDGMRVKVAGGNTGQSDLSGLFTIVNAGSSPVDVSANVTGPGSTVGGQWVWIDDQQGVEMSLSQNVTPPGPADFIFNSSPTQFTTAQINAFIWVPRTHNMVKATDPTYPGIDVQMRANVNLTSTCNAFYDGASVNFYNAGGGCPNTAYSTVMAHEYGHHIVASGHANPSGDFHEGVADVTAELLIDSDCLGRGFQGGTGCLRSGYNSVKYPCSGEVHTCGEVMSGAYWLTRDQMKITEPVNYLSIMRDLYVFMIKMSPTIDPSITVDVLTLDDDNGDIDDGTPHYNEIAAGFGAKNLTAPPLVYLDFTYPDGKPELVSPAGGTRMRVIVSGHVKTPQPGTGKLYYSTGGSYTAIPMEEVSSNVYDAVFPSLPCGSTVKYYVNAQTTDATEAFDPTNAPTGYYRTISAYGLTPYFDDNFETDQGWTVSNSGATTGIWARGTPAGGGARGDNPTDYNGSGQCYCTDPAAGDTDVDGGTTRLISPTFNLAGTNAIISYARWYSNSFGGDPHNDTMTVQITNNGTLWTTVETVGPVNQADGGWFTNSFKVSDYITPSATIKVRFNASDLGSGSVVEAAVDAFKVETLNCTPSNSLFGHIDLDLLSASPSGQAVTIEFRTPNTATVVASYPVVLDSLGNYNIPSVVGGTYDIAAKGANWLRQKLLSQTVSGTTEANFALINGDADPNNAVDLGDMNKVFINFANPGGDGDINWDGIVGVEDLSIIFIEFGANGDS